MSNSPEQPTQRRVALVTGASRGLGAAIACRLARDGLHVLLNYRSNEAAASEVSAQIVSAGGSAELCAFDVSDALATHEALSRLAAAHSISVLVNNAGVSDDAAFPTMTEQSWETVTRTTLDGFFHVTRPLVMPMVTARFGRIINIASASGLIGNRGQVNYSAAKAGLIGATRSLAQEVAKKKVTVNAIAPGLIETDMVNSELAAEMKKQIPMRRLGTAEEVAALVSFLAGEEASYITGQVISINGGLC